METGKLLERNSQENYKDWMKRGSELAGVIADEDPALLLDSILERYTLIPDSALDNTRDVVT